MSKLSKRQSEVKVAFETLEAMDAPRGPTSVAESIGVTKWAAHSAMKTLRRKGLISASGSLSEASEGYFEVDRPPEQERTVTELLEARKGEYERQRKYADFVKRIPVKIKADGPIGITHIGDPHLDNSGTDIAQIERHIQIIRNTDGMFGANVGDAQDNWVGRLSHLYSKTTVSQAESWKLVEWMVNEIPWLYIVGGNHDAWSGERDPLKYIIGNCRKIGFHKNWQVRMGLRFPNGRDVTLNCRHDFAGHSQWNIMHGPAKAVKMGVRDNLLICGHKHSTGYGVDKDPVSGKLSHFLRVGSYKKIDDYAEQGGFLDQNITPAAVTIIDPTYEQDDPRQITVFLSVEEGAEFLTWKRGRK